MKTSSTQDEVDARKETLINRIEAQLRQKKYLEPLFTIRWKIMNYHRQSARLQRQDYSESGAYFVTICTQDRKCLFGEVVEVNNAGLKIRLNEFGQIVENFWREIPIHFPGVELDAYVIMPNHVHGIIRIVRAQTPVVGARHAVPLPSTVAPPQSNAADVRWESFGKPVSGSIPTIIRSFKSAVTKRINELRQTPSVTVWQRSYYERVLRNETELNNVRQYILNNPLNWETNPENPVVAIQNAGIMAKFHSGGVR